MIMSPRLRKAVLVVHVATSVGWLGAVLAYLVLDVTTALGTDIEAVRAAYAAMEMTIWYAIVPLAIASLVIGIANSLGTPWGLVRHYWVVAKLLLTVFAVIVLMQEAKVVSDLAALARSAADPRLLPGTLPHSIGATLILLAATVLAIFKPRGLTRYGWRRKQNDGGRAG